MKIIETHAEASRYRRRVAVARVRARAVRPCDIYYYWKASRMNLRVQKWTRYLVVVIGALVTSLASLSAASAMSGYWQIAINVGDAHFCGSPDDHRWPVTVVPMAWCGSRWC